jgi:hypothetical protein
MRASQVLGAIALCVLPAACAQILGVDDFADQQGTGGGGLSVSGGSGGNAGAMDDSPGGIGGIGGMGVEVAGCARDFECDGATLIGCLEGIKSEVEMCASSALCDARLGECLPVACEPDEQRCNLAMLERCKTDLSDFDVVDECASSALCDPDQNECLPPACAAAEYLCTGSVLEACSDDRTGFVKVLDCTTRELCDDANGKCEVAACEPGQFKCSEATLLRCEDSGKAVKVEATCATEALCNETAGRCDAPVCDVNEHECVGTALRVCNANRDAFEPSKTCATGALCNANGRKCDPPACAAGQYDCQGNTLRVCNAGRTAFTTSDACTAGELCSSSPAKCQTYDELLGGFDGLLVETPCADTTNTDDCTSAGPRFNGGASTPCVAGKYDAMLEHEVGGTAGKMYDVTLRVYGIVEPRNYGPTVVREAGLTRPNAAENPSLPPPWATAPGGNVYASSSYNSYEVRVSDQNGGEVAAYYLNSDTQQGHYTFALDYERTIPVVGGGKIRFRTVDDNCRIIKNCPGGAPCASKARSVDIAAANPQPAALSQPGLGKDITNAGQWLLIDVVNVVPR